MNARTRAYAMLGALIVVGLSLEIALRRPEDWERVYLPAGGMLLQGRDFYDVRFTAFTYPPAAAAVAAIFTMLPAPLQLPTWLLLNVLALAVLWVCAWRASGGTVPLSPPDLASNWREHAVLLLGTVIALRFITSAVEHRQTDLLIAAATAGASLCVIRRQWKLAGALCGVGAAIKATPVLWVAYFMVKRRWSAVATLLAVAIGLSMIPDLMSRPPGAGTWLQRWIHVIVQPFVNGTVDVGAWYTAAVYNQSLAGTLHRLSLGVNAILLGEAVLLVAGLGAIAARDKTRDNERGAGRECAIVMILMVLLSPASSKPHFAVLLLPAYCVARAAFIDRLRVAAIALAGAIACTVVSHAALVGERLGSAGEWYGGITLTALFLLMGCAAPTIRTPQLPRPLLR